MVCREMFLIFALDPQLTKTRHLFLYYTQYHPNEAAYRYLVLQMQPKESRPLTAGE